MVHVVEAFKNSAVYETRTLLRPKRGLTVALAKFDESLVIPPMLLLNSIESGMLTPAKIVAEVDVITPDHTMEPKTTENKEG